MNIKREKGGWRFKVKDKLYFINLPAYHDIYNALAAIAVGTLFGIDCKDVAGALNEYKPLEKRMTRSTFEGVEFIIERATAKRVISVIVERKR